MTVRRRRVSGEESQGAVDASGDDVGGFESDVPGARSRRPGVQWANIVTDTLKIGNPSALATRLREELTLGDDRVSYGIVIAALDKSASNLELAARLHRAAKTEDQRFAAECNERLEVLRSTALAELMVEYHEKRRRSPTKEDIEDRMVMNWPDEYRSIKSRMSELHNATGALESLRDAWASRCADLRIVANRVSPNQ